MASRYRILAGQSLQLHYISDSSALIRAWARVQYDSGIDSILYVPDQAMVGTRVQGVLAPSEVAIESGWVTDAVVQVLDNDIKRGRAYVQLIVAPESQIFGTLLCSDYCFSGIGQVALGTYVQPGPGGGGGNLYWEAIKALGAPATFAYTVAVTQMIRKVREIVWSYVASSDAANRTMQLKLRSAGGSTLATGYPAGNPRDVYHNAGITLTADQSGIVGVDEQRGYVNDNGTFLSLSRSTLTTPLPLLIPEGSGVTIDGVVANEQGADVDICWGLFEDWILP